MPDAQYDPQGLNPVQKELQALLLAHAPGLLSTQWEVSDGATHLVPNQSAAPQELHTVTQRGALLGQVHLLRGSGLVLHPVRSSVLHSKQYHVILRADRVNDYDYVGDVPGMSIGLYWTGYYKRGRKRSETTETGYDVNIGTTVIPPGKTVEARFVPGVKVSQTSAKTSDNATTPVDTMRDTYRQIELAHRYSGKFRITIELVSATRPSTEINTLLLGVPNMAARKRYRAPFVDGGARTNRVRTVDLLERVIISSPTMPKLAERAKAAPAVPYPIVEVDPQRSPAGYGRRGRQPQAVPGDAAAGAGSADLVRLGRAVGHPIAVRHGHPCPVR